MKREVEGMENMFHQDSKTSASSRRMAWAQSKDCTGQQSKTGRSVHQPRGQIQDNGHTEHPAEKPRQVTSNTVDWVNECSPHRASLDDPCVPMNKGALRTGCSFEDDLSLGAEANHLQKNSKTTQPSFEVADQKRSQFKARGSMNSTGSGKSSTVSSVSELLDLYEEDPEEILLNLGFGREEPDLSSRIPCRFLHSTSAARGIDATVYLAAQHQRMELENPNYALTSRFRQIEVLTTVANEFFQLYSQVSGQPVQQINTDRGVKKEVTWGGEEPATPTKNENSKASLFRRVLSKQNLRESIEAQSSSQHKQLNGHAAAPDHALTNGHTPTVSVQDRSHHEADPQSETLSQKHNRKKESGCLETVKEETSTDGVANQQARRSAEPEPPVESVDPQTSHQKTDVEGPQPAAEECDLSHVFEKRPSTPVPPHLSNLRKENADSFDMEEIQDEAVPSRNADLLRTISLQSDSSGFAEEPAVESSHLKGQDSSDSCDSETTVTSHPSQDVTTPHALDVKTFEIPDSLESANSNRNDEQSDSGAQAAEAQTSEQVPRYRTHNFPKSSLATGHVQKSEEAIHFGNDERTAADSTVETVQSTPVIENEPNQGSDHKQDVSVQEPEAGSLNPVIPSSPVYRALERARQNDRRGSRMQRSSSLPSSFHTPPKVVSSVKIHFGRGQVFCTPPRYTFEPPQEETDGTEEENALDEDEEDTNGQSNCLSTLIINPGLSQTPAAESQTQVVPHSLTLPSSYPRSASPPNLPHLWSTQSTPELSSIPQKTSMSLNQQRWNPGHSSFSLGNIRNPPPLTTNSLSHYPYFSPPQAPNYHHACFHSCSLTSLHSTPPAPPQQNPQFVSPCSAYQGHASNPQRPFSHHLPPEHGFHPGLVPLDSSSLGPSHNPSSTEMQLRRVLHEIRGTVQSMSRGNTPDIYGEQRPSLRAQSMEEFQQKRQSLNMFCSQMGNLELSIMRQQAQVYNHLSPADRLEADRLQTLRSAVREELQELEQQLEESMRELTQRSQRRGLLRGGSVDSLSTASALRAMEPMSELLREQYLLQAELNYDSPGRFSYPSTRSSSPGREVWSGDRPEQRQYRSCINLTPAPPRRANTISEEQVTGSEGAGEGSGSAARARDERAGRLRVENFQQLIQEIRESVAQEVRREIYNELLAAVSPRASTPSANQHQQQQ